MPGRRNRSSWIAAFFILAALLTGAAMQPLPNRIELARAGRTDYAVVTGRDATAAELFAARELTNYLFKVTGAVFPVVSETNRPAAARGVYVGWTDYAAGQGIAAAALGAEEWVLKTAGQDLVLAGGRPRGTLYAVYEFLETRAGCRWLDARGAEIVPASPTLLLADLDVRGQPRFRWREIQQAYVQRLKPTAEAAQSWTLFRLRNKSSLGHWYPEQYGSGGPLYGAPGNCHTFYMYLNASNWFATHPEYFALVKGKRIPAATALGPGQMCMTHPEVRRIVLEKLRGYIRQDREAAARKGTPPPKIYDISQNDTAYGECECDGCRAIAEREGSHSGPLIDFINAIADGIREEYPDILVQTFAYNRTQPPPKNLKPRGNVMIRWCDVYSAVDFVRPLSHPCNSNHFSEVVGWGAKAAHLAIWDYWIAFAVKNVSAPHCIIQCLQPDLKLFADVNAEIIYAEAEENFMSGENFTALRCWLAYKLMQDPGQPVEPLIQAFLDGYYGPASGKMGEYLRYLQERIDRDAGFMQVRNEQYALKYLDLEFFSRSAELFDAAEALCRPGRPELRRVQQERNKVDLCLLTMWDDIVRKLPSGTRLPWPKESVIKRYEANVNAVLEAFHSQAFRDKSKPGLDQHIALFRDPRLPECVAGAPAGRIVDINWTFLQNWEVRPARIVADKEAACGYAVCFTEADNAKFGQPLPFEISYGKGPTNAAVTLAGDGQYHCYKVGRFELTRHSSICMGRPRAGVFNVKRAYDPDAEDNVWDCYVSLKAAGPGFIPGSAGTNTLWLERILMVKPPGK